jgi:predicted phosphodiesterase
MVVGTVGDLHEPFTHPQYLDFCRDTFKQWRVDRVVVIGDVVDSHALGFWEHDPDGRSAKDETDLAKLGIKRWKRAFKDALVCIGNHDARYMRLARKAGIPVQFMRDYADVFDTPRWEWAYSHEIDGVLYEHGTNSSGKFAAFNRAINKRQSVVMGHTHTTAGCLYHTNENDRIFGLQVGCGIDCSAYAFAYGKDFAVRPALGCGIVVDGSLGVFEPMPISHGEPYERNQRC